MAYPPTWIRVYTHESSAYSRFIQLICDTRGLRSDVAVDHTLPGEHLSVSERSLTISGFWPSVEYLMAKFPEPELLHGDNVSRCIARSLTHDLLAMGKVDGHFLGPLQDGHWHGRFPVGRDKLSLVDVAYLATLDPRTLPAARLLDGFKRYVGEQLRAA